MINPYKVSEGIQSFYLSQDGKISLSSGGRTETKYCKPDMNWIYRKCMMKSPEYREWMETQYTQKIPLHPLIAKIPPLRDYIKPRLINEEPGRIYGMDYTVETPVFNKCALAYQDYCQKYQNRKDIEDKFNLN